MPNSSSSISRAERQRLFLIAVKGNSLWQGASRVAQGFGVSNSPNFCEPGLELIDADLAKTTEEVECLVFAGSSMVPPGDELFIAVYVRSGVEDLHLRLRAMVEAGKRETDTGVPNSQRENAARNNNVAVLVSKTDGNLYLRNKGRWIDEPADVELTGFGPGIVPDRVEIAVYPPQRSAIRNLTIQTHIGHLGQLFGNEKIFEIQPWTGHSGHDYSAFAVDPRSLDSETVAKRVADLGGYYRTEFIENFHLSLNFNPKKHFVILTGLSGTGKTSLVLKYSRAIHDITESDRVDPFLFVCPVRPDWTDPTGLLGYFDVISNRYIVPRFLEAVLAATAYPSIPVFVCLDELNIAHVEYYFSDILSCIESREPIRLHEHTVPLEGSNGEEIPASAPMPDNLFIVGTVNVDETTQSISDKVLDRAMVIDTTDEVDLDGFLDSLKARDNGLEEAIEKCGAVLSKTHNQLKGTVQGFGYRTCEEFVRYVAFALDREKSDVGDLIDRLICEKILTKLRGDETDRQILDRLHKSLSSYKKSLKRIEGLLEDLSRSGAFQAMR